MHIYSDTEGSKTTLPKERKPLVQTGVQWLNMSSTSMLYSSHTLDASRSDSGLRP